MQAVEKFSRGDENSVAGALKNDGLQVTDHAGGFRNIDQAVTAGSISVSRSWFAVAASAALISGFQEEKKSCCETDKFLW